MPSSLAPAATETKTGIALSEFVYAQLRREILSGVLRPNQALVEADLAERLMVSRMPVREGLLRLANDGLVESKRRRWTVHEHTQDEVRWIYEVRAALEAEAASLAALRASEEQRAVILETGQPHLFAKAPTRDIRFDANETFHGHIIAAAANPRIADTLARNVTYFNFRFALFSSQVELDESGEQHLEIAQAIAAANVERARQVAHDHVMHALRIIERAVE
ncbi:GntR family transcriptional regulator [Acuticoccus mangrovi]|uniref:GntR family transcriptional regulator n=1 Tax=Acuticoccus mangrovi TaxID=2796142 RepID=A0A934MI88_9HYPH|nr:GntR family transcriptional regulator [Acuticoccus mangrovi]MBJ3776921.1 GntR family transcriptional regulator [Acuticoccus mangrovi]